MEISLETYRNVISALGCLRIRFGQTLHVHSELPSDSCIGFMKSKTFLLNVVTVVVEMPLVMMIHSLSVIVGYIALYIYISLISRSVIKISP